MRPHSLIPLLAVLLLVACATDAPIEQESAAAAGPDAIDWFDGTVEEAFAAAAEQGKPIFLYWGAVWCPPCHYLKDKIFQRPEFVARSTNFVMVYLDGDTERAQVYGDRFGMTGYPTVIVFGADGEERMRMPSTVEPELYGELMDDAMTMRSIPELVAAVRQSGAATAAPGDLRLLAYYSWEQDHLLELGDEELLTLFEQLQRETPEALRAEKSRFLGLYVTQLIRLQRDPETIPAAARLDDGQRAVLDREVRRILGDPELRAANLELLLYWSAETVDLLHPATSVERTSLMAEWGAAATVVEADESLTLDDRLSALVPRLELAKIGAGEMAEGETAEGETPAVPGDLVAEIRQRIAWALDAATEPGEMQTVLNTSAHLLDDAGLPDEAEIVLLDNMGRSKAPWYFMGWLGGLREDAGEPIQALEWYRKAYDSAEGRYTRFRWGSSYLRSLMELAPEDEATIAAESERILGELLTFEDAFAHGNYSRLSQLDRAYRAWNEEGAHQQVLDALREQVQAGCADFPAAGEDSQASRCEGFLAPEEAEPKAD